MESPTKLSRTPKMPLFPLSPARVNRVVSGADSTASDSSIEPRLHSKPVPPPQSSPPPDFNLLSIKRPDLSNREVQGIVARFDALDIKDHAELRRKDVAALRRAQMGREEAESDLKKAREDIRRMKKEAEESADRERRLAKRLEIVSDDLTHEKEIRATGISKYEKEMRTARKEAFRSSSAVVKLQEELKASRASLNKIRTDLDTEKGRSRQREQEAFSAQYELVGAQEALQKEIERCKVIESERDALKTQLKEEEVARVAAEGMIALPKPSTSNEDDEFASPRKARTPSGRTQKQDAMVSRLQGDLQLLREEVDDLQYSKDEAERQIDFMKMECQFRCCSCRVAEQAGDHFMHDASLAESMVNIRPESRFAFEPKPDVIMAESPVQPVPEGIVPSRPTTPAPAQEPKLDEEEDKEPVIFSPQSGTFRRSSAAQTITEKPSESDMKIAQVVVPLASENVTTQRPTVYINGNGHAHEAEHQPRRRTRQSVKLEEKTLDDTMIHTPPTEEEPVSDAPHAYESEEDPAETVDCHALPSPTRSIVDDIDDVEDADPAEADEDEDYLIQSPTAHIAATTVTTTIPLAPLSSPCKPAPTTISHDDDDFSVNARQEAEKTPSRPPSRARHAATPALPNNDKENADPRTPMETQQGKGEGWTPLGETGLTRQEAIARLRARRELERARADDPPRLAAGVTPLRAASHGSSARKAHHTPARRDVSAPEVRSVRR